MTGPVPDDLPDVTIDQLTADVTGYITAVGEVIGAARTAITEAQTLIAAKDAQIADLLAAQGTAVPVAVQNGIDGADAAIKAALLVLVPPAPPIPVPEPPVV